MTIGMANLAVLAKKWDRLLRVELSKRQSYKAGPGVEGTSNNKKLLGAPGIATNGAFLLVTRVELFLNPILAVLVPAGPI